MFTPRTLARTPLLRSYVARRAISVSALAAKDKTPGVPPQKILDEYDEHRVEKTPEAASIGDHTFTHPKVSHDLLHGPGDGVGEGWGCLAK